MSVLQYVVRDYRKQVFFFYPLYMLRRLLYLFIFWYISHPVAQFQLLMIINFCSLVYCAHHRPFLFRLQNYYEWYNQLSILLVTILMCMFTDFVPSRETQLAYGTVMIIVICLHMLVSLYLIWTQMTDHLELVLPVLFTLIKGCCMNYKARNIKPIVEEPFVPYSPNYLIMQILNT